MRHTIYITGDDPRIVNKIRDAVANSLVHGVGHVILPFLATTADGHQDPSKALNIYKLTIEDDGSADVHLVTDPDAVQIV